MFADHVFEVRTSKVDGPAASRVSVVAVTGELDIETHPALDEHITAACHDEGHVLLDLSSTSFMDSSGLRTILAGHRVLAEQRRRLALVAQPDGPIARLLALTATDRYLSRYPDRHTAIDALSA